MSRIQLFMALLLAGTAQAADAPNVISHEGRRTAAQSPSAASRAPTRIQQPGAVRSGMSPNPPASAPAMAPSVFQA